jgi:glycosidase
VYHRSSKSGIHHGYEIFPHDPIPDQPVTLVVETGPDLAVEKLACYYTSDGDDPVGSHGQAEKGQVAYFHEVESRWDNFVWGYRKKWQALLPPQKNGTEVRYVISGWDETGTEIFADWPDVKLTVERAAKHYFDHGDLPEIKFCGDPSSANVFNYYVDALRPPQWAKEAIFYHIFVDRFHPGKGKDWIQTSHPKKAFGGTLVGVTDHLDYIHELGVTAIWLSPIFPSPSIHRYDALDYYQVADELGGDQALRDLISKAHRRGIRIILDLVCNHVSNRHPYFVDALQDENSKYRDWFYFDDEDEIGYRTFFGVRGMPQVNLKHPGARAWMLDIARYYLEEFDVDGYRLDYANGPGVGFWGEFWQVCKQTKPDSIIFGEVVEPSDVMLPYVGRMDGLLDFPLCEAFRKGLGTEEWSPQRFRSFVNDHLAFFQDDFLLFSFLDNHDMNRFLFTADNKVETLKKAAELQFQLPGPPIIYYGTEVGMQQMKNKTSAIGLEASRGKMAWGEEQDQDLFDYYKRLIEKRMTEKPWSK